MTRHLCRLSDAVTITGDQTNNDAQQNRSRNYKRYRSKYNRTYERDFRDGYNAGFDTRPSFGRWTAAQRTAYETGYNVGANDRFMSRGSNPGAQQSRHAASVRPYYFQGYMDGYGGIPRRYDFPVGQNPGYPGNPGNPGTNPPWGGSTTGSATWSGRVDKTANIIISGNTIRAVDISNSGVTTTQQYVNGSLPRRPATVTVRKRDGRGTVRILEQPNSRNNYQAVIRIEDPRGGSDNYRIEVTWQGSNVIEPYQRGSVTWSGRVDHRVYLYISGRDVYPQVIEGTAVQNDRFNFNGYLARRPGSVSVRKRDGRGDVRVVEQPSASNDYVAVIEIYDDKGGADNYRVEVSW